jgi:membrane-associated protease RseP (regulator of RpoE activity)
MPPVLSMLLLISMLIILHELGHYWVARLCGVKVERFGFGLPFGPTLWKKKIGDTEYCLHAALFGGYVAFPDDNPNSDVPKDSKQRFENQSLLNRAAIALAGVTVNAITGWVLLVVVLMGWGLPTLDVKVDTVVPGANSPAVLAGLKGGELIQAINGKPVEGYFADERLGFVKKIIHENPGKAISMQVRLPNGTSVSKMVTPSAAGTIGIKLGGMPKTLKIGNPIVASSLSAQYVAYIFQVQFEVLGKLFTGKISPKEFSGPIGIVTMGAEKIEKEGIQQGLMLAAILSVALAFMNLLPIPALDGGHLLFLAIEAIMRKPVRKDVQEKVVTAGFVTLLMFMGFVLWNDLQNIIFKPAPHNVEEAAPAKSTTPKAASSTPAPAKH